METEHETEHSLEDLIADSLCGVQAAGASVATSATDASAAEAKEAERFSDLGKLFEGELLEKVLVDAFEAESVAKEPETVDFLQSYLQKFEGDVEGEFGTTVEGLFKTMLSPALLCEPLRRITDAMDPWLKEKKGLKKPDKQRYEQQLELYRKVIDIYTTAGDPLPEDKLEEAKKLLDEAEGLGSLPEEVLKQMAPPDAEEGTENLQDFFRSMSLDEGLSGPETTLLKKLTADPEDLQNAMQEVALTLANEEDCKLQ